MKKALLIVGGIITGGLLWIGWGAWKLYKKDTPLGWPVAGIVAGLVLFMGVIAASGEEQTKQADKPQEQTQEAKKPELPAIPTEAQEMAISEIKKDTLVKDAAVVIEGDTINLAIVVNAATNEEHAKRLGDNFVRMLASFTAFFNENDLKGPTKDYLGELWDYYNLNIGVGTGPDHFIVQGAKVKTAQKITW